MNSYFSDGLKPPTDFNFQQIPCKLRILPPRCCSYRAKYRCWLQHAVTLRQMGNSSKMLHIPCKLQDLTPKCRKYRRIKDLSLNINNYIYIYIIYTHIIGCKLQSSSSTWLRKCAKIRRFFGRFKVQHDANAVQIFQLLNIQGGAP